MVGAAGSNEIDGALMTLVHKIYCRKNPREEIELSLHCTRSDNSVFTDHGGMGIPLCCGPKMREIARADIQWTHKETAAAGAPVNQRVRNKAHEIHLAFRNGI